jgi:glucose/arabinose dehydrogenase
MAIAPDGRIFVCQQGGALRVIKNFALLPEPFMTLTVDPNGERGLLGIAFDPNFPSNNFLYVYYTVPFEPRHNRVSRFTANGDVVEPGSEVILLELNNLTLASNHNGGALHFGPDGKLYIATGENATRSNSQTLANMLGKILRINSDGSIPTDNPFFNQATGNNRSIWALGLRNPFTFAFQPGTGRMFINDVGESTWEEINDGIAGSNYGWPTTEGPTANPSFRSPLFAYNHGFGPTTGFAITGGAFYNPVVVQFGSSFVGKYFFADLGSGWIRVFDPATGTASPFAAGISQPVDIKVGADGSLYYLSYTGRLFRVRFTPPVVPQPLIATEPNSDIAIALDSPTMSRDPFALTNLINFSLTGDHQTRISLFVTNVDSSAAVTAQAQDAGVLVWQLPVEFVGDVPGIEGVKQVVVRLHPGLPTNQSVFVSVNFKGQTSNKARVRIK